MNQKIQKKILEVLADHLGVGVDDLNPEDSFSEDLHMSAADFMEFIHTLNKEDGIEVKIDQVVDIETVDELIEIISDEEAIK